MTHPTPEERAKAIVNAVNADYADETFVSEGYGYFDDMTAAIAQALRETAEQARREALEEAAKLCEDQRDYYLREPVAIKHAVSAGGIAIAIRSRIAQKDGGEKQV